MSQYSPLELAQAFIRTGEITDALDALNTALAADATHQEARRLRAEVHARGTDETSLRAALADYAALDTLTVTDALRCAALWQRLGDTDAALAMLNTARAQYPDDERVVEQQVMLSMARGQYAEARALIAQMPQTWRWLTLAADADAAHGQHATAAESLTRALDLLAVLPDHDTPFWTGQRVRLLCARGRAYRAEARYTDAQGDYAVAHALMPNDLLVVFNQGALMILQNNHDGVGLCRTAYQQANAELRAVMRADIDAEPRLQTLLATLEG